MHQKFNDIKYKVTTQPTKNQSKDIYFDAIAKNNFLMEISIFIKYF